MPTPPELPPEIWRHILSYIDSSVLLPICGVNHLFHDVALDHRYRRVWLGYISDARILKIKSLKDPWLAKRVKSLYLATGAVGARADASRVALPVSKAKSHAGYSDILSSFLPSVVRKRVTYGLAEDIIDGTQLDVTSTSAESLLPLLYVVLDQLKNVSELDIIADHTGDSDFELDFLRKLCCLFASRSVQALGLRIYELHLILPFTQFVGLKKVSLTLLPSPNPSALSADAFSQLLQFLNRIAPSVEVLCFATPDYGIVEQLSSSLHPMTMPNVRELETPLMFNDLGTNQSLDSKYPSLSVLKLYPWSPREGLTQSLGCLQLVGLRSLTLSSLGEVSVPSLFGNGSSGFPHLEELRIINEYLFSDNVDMICKFFASSSITRLELYLFYLNAHILDSTSLYFPVLHTFDLRTVYVTLATEPGSIGLRERQYPDWHVSVINLKLSPEAPEEIVHLLQRCIPNLHVVNAERLLF
ncbi:hypothetical protein AB1N83_009354 [Pleurotus pulmonarius]